MESGIVFDIERFAVHDGPGIRTVVFLKGCLLQCPWCANPESHTFAPQLGYLESKCIGCMRCARVCPCHDEADTATGRPDWEKCTACFRCVDACLSGARIPYGRRMRVDEVVKQVLKDKPFYENSHGGVTLSGGEACCQPAFSAGILSNCRKYGIHTSLETSGHVQWDIFQQVIAHVDCLLYDIKHMDSCAHERVIGVGNEKILDNAQRANGMVEQMIIRVPLIPGFNDSLEHVERLMDFVSAKLKHVETIHLLPFHTMGESKCPQIGKQYAFLSAGEGTFAPEQLDRLRRTMEAGGFRISIGG